jgi:NADPH:quinone reductase-like Zn-dependent oxidoreductase
MRAVLMTAVGGPDVLKLADVPEPERLSDGKRMLVHRALEAGQVIGKVVLVME